MTKTTVPMRLDSATFQTIIQATPLVSIDLLIRNAQGEILVGKRLDRPARGYWFVPGGRILKGETLANAFRRITGSELGSEYDIASGRYLGLYEHFYEDTMFTDQVSTHYVVNAFEICLFDVVPDLPFEQHDAYQWMSEVEFLNSDNVHVHNKCYLDSRKGFF